MQQYWSRKFEITSNSIWEKIYREKIKKIFDKSVAEFNFKMLRNLLSCNMYISKWKNINKNCPYCGTNKSIEHLIFNCNLSKDIWRYISDKVHFDITWKIIVIGFYSECNNVTYTFNNIFPSLLSRYIITKWNAES
jgi:hypothetical protein